MKSTTILKTGAIICGLTVIIGAFGAHALRPILESNDRVSPFETGVLYQMFHGLAILVVGIVAHLQPYDPHEAKNRIAQISSIWIIRAFWCFLLGVVLFSGSLYGLAIWPAMGWLGPVTPIGGVFFILGWISVFQSITTSSINTPRKP